MGTTDWTEDRTSRTIVLYVRGLEISRLYLSYRVRRVDLKGFDGSYS